MAVPDVARLGEAFPVAVPDVARLGEAAVVRTVARAVDCVAVLREGPVGRVVAQVTGGPVAVDLCVAVGTGADVARVVTAEVLQGDSSEETVGCVRVVGAVPACVDEEAVAGRLGVCMGPVGVAGEPSPVLGISAVLAVAVAGVVSVAGEPVGAGVVGTGMHGMHVPLS